MMQGLARMRLAGLAAACAVAWFLSCAVQSLSLLDFGDETEHIVGARMIAAGDRLYSTIFVNHGPLAYALNHLWLLLTGTRDVASHRLLSLGLFMLCAGAIFTSPALSQTRARLYALTLFLVPLGVFYVPTTLHMVMYQSIGGALLTIELALFSMPAVFGRTPPGWAAIAAGFAAACTVFTALSFAVSAALLAAAGVALPADAAGMRRRAIGGFLAGALAGLLVLGAWMTLFADWVGYFVYHYWFNLTVYADLIRYSPLAPLRVLTRFEIGPDTLIHIFAIAVYYAAFSVLILLTRPRAWTWASLRWCLGAAALAIGVAFFNPRGNIGFHESTFVAGVLGVGALVAANLLAAGSATARFARARTVGARAFIGVLAAALVMVHQFGRSSPHGIPLAELSRHRGTPKPSDERVYRLVRELVPAGERILAVVFVPAIYVLADRLPVSGNFFYLPMQARYEKQPLWGYHIDLCKDVTERRPKVVFWLDRVGTGQWGFAEYAPCVHREIVNNYVQLPWAREFFIRRDVAAARPDILSN
jgi:hypothetical protein